MSEKNAETVQMSNNLFTANMYEILSRKKGNVIFSPLSAHAVLSMAFQGASGATLDAFIKTLQLPDAKTTANGYKEIMNSLNSLENVTLSMANKVYVKEGAKLLEKFKQVITKQFQSEIENINFGQNEQAVKIINEWVKKRTQNKIKELVQKEDLNEATCLVLLNAIYFKGTWGYPFDKDLTKKEPFYVNDKETIEVEMMHDKKEFYYNNNKELDAQILELQYQNRTTSMYIILPNDRYGIEALEKKLIGKNLLEILRELYKTEVTVYLPKFKVEQTIGLNDVLVEMGLGVIFDQGKADFSEMVETDQRLVLSKVLQKAFIEINEEGAEAGAATCMKIAYLCARVSKEPLPYFKADHPFVFVLKDAHNILFLGRYSESPVENFGADH